MYDFKYVLVTLIITFTLFIYRNYLKLNISSYYYISIFIYFTLLIICVILLFFKKNKWSKIKLVNDSLITDRNIYVNLDNTIKLQNKKQSITYIRLLSSIILLFSLILLTMTKGILFELNILIIILIVTNIFYNYPINYLKEINFSIIPRAVNPPNGNLDMFNECNYEGKEIHDRCKTWGNFDFNLQDITNLNLYLRISDAFDNPKKLPEEWLDLFNVTRP